MGESVKPVIKNDPKKSAKKGAEDAIVSAVSVLITLLVMMQLVGDEEAQVLRDAMGAFAAALPIVMAVVAAVIKFVMDMLKTRRAE